jgi:hypothetical protein
MDEHDDVEMRGTINNPIVDHLETAERYGEPAAEAQQQQEEEEEEEEEEEQQHQRSSSKPRMGGALTAENMDTFNGVHLILLLTGAAPPPSFSPFLIFRFFWPLSLALGVAIQFGWVVDDFQSGAPTVAYTVDLPTALGMIAGISCYTWIWSRAKTLISEDASLVTSEQRKGAVLWSAAYIVLFMVLGMSMFIWESATGTYSGENYRRLLGVFPWGAVDWITLFGVTPILGATLLVLRLDAAAASLSIRKLIQVGSVIG